jgi:hypothetical protein
MSRASLLAWLVVLPLGCAADSPNVATGTDGSGSDDDDDDDDDPSSAESAPSTTDPSGGTMGTTGGTDDPTGGSQGETESGEEIPPPPATGIQIVDVTADQAVRVPIVLDGVLVDGPQRNAPILKDRPIVLRAFYELDPEFEPRDIYATLYVEQTDGTRTEHANYVTAIHKDCGTDSRIDCRYGTLPNSFYWRLPAEEVQPGTTYRIELLETAPGHEDDVSDKIPVFPTDGGSMPIGVEDSYMKMRVVLVPVDHNLNGSCPEPPDLSEDMGPGIDGNDRTVADFFAERLAAANPVDEVEIISHDVVSYQGSLTGSQLLGALQNLRFQEDYPPEYFYYAVARPCDSGPDFAGVAQLGGPTPGQASYRVGWGVYYSNVGTTADTFVHEIGHEQGRAHIACNGEEGGPDPSYPGHPDGDLLNWGIDVFGTQIEVFQPSDHDYMTYCQSTWVSEWGYLKVLPWIQEMSSWELGDHGGAKQPLLVGNLRADGSEEWYLTEGFMPPEVSIDHTVRFAHGGVVTDVQRAAWVQWERSEDVNVIVPAPIDFTSVSELAWTDAKGVAHEIDRASVRGGLDAGLTLQ